MQCRCRYHIGRIVFCSVHERAENLLAVVERLERFLSGAAMASEKDEIMRREIIVPYLQAAIGKAKRDVPPIGET